MEFRDDCIFLLSSAGFRLILQIPYTHVFHEVLYVENDLKVRLHDVDQVHRDLRQQSFVVILFHLKLFQYNVEQI